MVGSLDDTIAAISTGMGESGIGIVRMSGNRALGIAERVFKPKGKRGLREKGTYALTYGKIVDPSNGEVIDEAIVAVMLAPHSYTREDVVEINCHGGPLPLRRTLELVLEEGCRIAEPGEFTKRAFLNGRLDLAQAEAVIEVIRAKSEHGLHVALQNLDGGLSRRIRESREVLLRWIAQIEAGIDFPEDEVEAISVPELEKDICHQISKLNDLIGTSQTGKILREGYRVVISGKPNVGKSSLLNSLLREGRAIVTEVPGTTRDSIEEWANIRGVAVVLVDTAGLRDTVDPVESIGVQLTKRHVQDADLVLLVLDDSTGITSEDRDIIDMLKSQNMRNLVVIINKIDLGKRNIGDADLESLVETVQTVRVSAATGQGIEDLERMIVEKARASFSIGRSGVVLTRIRHREALERAVKSLADALGGIRLGCGVDLVSIDLRTAWEALGEVTGETVREDIIDRVFADFCIGK